MKENASGHNHPQEQEPITAAAGVRVAPCFYQFINNEVLPLTSVTPSTFWEGLDNLINEMAPRNSSLLEQRVILQEDIDGWYREHRWRGPDASEHLQFLKSIGYLVPEGESFTIGTENLDEEISQIAGPQLVVPLSNARFAVNAANARWQSLYDALAESDVILHGDATRESQIDDHVKSFLDTHFPLSEGSHKDVEQYLISYENVLAFLPQGVTGLKVPQQLAGFDGSKEEPQSILLRKNNLHVELCMHSTSGARRPRGCLEDVIVESALTTIMDCEDSVADVAPEEKVRTYRNWLGLTQGTLTATFTRRGALIERKLNCDRHFQRPDGSEFSLHGRSLLLIRNVGLHIDSELTVDARGAAQPEGIVDAMVTGLIGLIDVNRQGRLLNSRTGSIYVVKPKLHGPEEVAFSCELFSRVETLLGLPPNTMKIGIMDEERRTSANLKECIRVAKDRVFFINTGFLDRTGDEIHTSMWAGPFKTKDQLKRDPWLDAYEKRNVSIALSTGFHRRAQVGKGMWTMPDEMNRLVKEKHVHPLAGATTAWVPSPTAAVFHALHYFDIDVFAVQRALLDELPKDDARRLEVMLSPALMPARALGQEEICRELEGNIQSIIGYVARWIDHGIGCSKIPDINDVMLMEDRATLRISCQLLANWLQHKVCTQDQVMTTMRRMAKLVDEQNANVPGYQPISPGANRSLAFEASVALVFEAAAQPNGYTEDLLYSFRRAAKRIATQQTTATETNRLSA